MSERHEKLTFWSGLAAIAAAITLFALGLAGAIRTETLAGSVCLLFGALGALRLAGLAGVGAWSLRLAAAFTALGLLGAVSLLMQLA